MYNHRAFINVNKVVNQVDEIGALLERRGKQRYLLQKHLTVIKSSNSFSLQQFNELKENQVFNSKFGRTITKEAYPDLINWRKVQQTRQYLQGLINQFPIDNPQDVVNNQAFLLEDWTNRMVDTLDKIQQQDIQLASRLNNLMTTRLAKVVTVNVTLVACLFLIVFGYSYKKHKANLSKKLELNESLVSRERALVSSKKVLISLMEDLSQEKNATIKLSKNFESVNQKLKIKNSDMEQFIYTISHDLKAPLVTISSFSETLYQQLKSSLDEKQDHKFIRIKENVRDMQGLLSDLLEISRVMNQDLEKSSIDTSELLACQLVGLQELIEQSEAKIVIKEPILEVFGNSRLIGLCITNLVSNAIRHRDLERELVIEISTEMSSDGVKLNIKDNGLGIEEKDFKRIFKVFERLSEREGSGVGLAIVKAVIDKHDGIIQLDSTLGKGSTFSLTFPFANG